MLSVKASSHMGKLCDAILADSVCSLSQKLCNAFRSVERDGGSAASRIDNSLCSPQLAEKARQIRNAQVARDIGYHNTVGERMAVKLHIWGSIICVFQFG